MLTFALCAVFFLSGASALVFENLWFRQTGLALGNSVWASSLVLTAFMAGLALGNAVAARFGERVAHPLRVYAALEIAIAVTGPALVFGLPALGPALSPWLGVLGEGWLLNPVRLGVAFAVLLVPSTAMGATLPLLVRTLSARDSEFGRVLGRLYGWNTLGAVAGTLATELVLVGSLGIRGSAWVAAGANLLAAGLAALLAAKGMAPRGEAAARGAAGRLSNPARRLLLVAFLSGLGLLALEVVWFRFLLLFLPGTSLAFAWMLGVVLAFIALGGLATSLWVRVASDATAYLVPLAFCAGAIVVASYGLFSAPLQSVDATYVKGWTEILLLSLFLMAPVSFLSGCLFTLTGTALQRELAAEARASGLLTLANTTGAALGSLLAGFVLLPGLGMERSFCAVAGLYAIIGLVIPSPSARIGRVWRLGPGFVLGTSLVLFPFGLMHEFYLPWSAHTFVDRGEQIVAFHEGQTETIVYTRTDRHDEPFYHRLITNGFSMTASTPRAQRYMKLYVYWPVALHPDPKHALLISFGVGMTAKALTDTAGLETIDVVDISKEILEQSVIVHPDPAEHPLQDPRVRVHVEDGRYFLQTTQQRFDLITGEPPPPKLAGVVNLYTREYFELVRERLAPGGIVTYWLPVRGLSEADSRVIVRAFCEAFDDCSLWLGTTMDWMLVGTRDARGPVSREHFVAQWNDARVGPTLRALGLETPAQLGALFLGDSEQLTRFTGGTRPLEDDWPLRLSRPEPGGRLPRFYWRWMDPAESVERFRESAFIRRLWPPELRAETLASFRVQGLVNQAQVRNPERRPEHAVLPVLHRALTKTSLRTLPLWLLGTDPLELEILERVAARGGGEPGLGYRLAARALAERDFVAARDLLEEALDGGSEGAHVRCLLVYAGCMAGDCEEAWARAGQSDPAAERDAADWRWLQENFPG
jgi:predicted membrane-bound spermidine synthase